MLRSMMIGAALLALAACGQSDSFASKEAVESGEAVAPGAINAPSQQEFQGGAQQAMLSAEERAQLETLVKGYLDHAQQRAAQGMRPAAGIADEITSLQPGRDSRYEVDLNAGVAYKIIGGCDNECSNLDIEIIDRRGAVVASDMAPDDFPVVSFRPAQSGRYTVRLLMQTCTVAPCYAGARVLQ